MTYRLYTLSGWAMRAFVSWRQSVTGIENLPAGGFVLAANHVSNLDPFVLAAPLLPRRVRYMAKAELFNRWLGWAMRSVATFPVRRGEPDTDAWRTALKLVREGEIVGMFPEGTRAKKGLRKKRVPRPHSGTARIALSADVPLVPAAIAGTDRLMRLGRISIVYGSPLELDDLAGLPRRRAAEVATERLMTAISALTSSIAPGDGRGEPER